MRSSMKISVTGYSRFKSVLDKKLPVVLEMPEGTLRDALEALSRRYGKKFEDMVFEPREKEVKKSNLILLNGQSYLNLRDRLRSELKDGDEILLMPIVVGG